jgi:hypothetical protein
MRPFIDQETGEIDHLAIVENADLRAAREFGGPNPPPRFIRAAVAWCVERSRAEHRAWRRDRGLPSDEPVTMVEMPAWGASGDSYGRIQ